MTTRTAALATPLAVGAAVALALGAYAGLHDATGRDAAVLWFDDAAAWKSALASVVAAMAVVQLSLGLRLAGLTRPGVRPPAWMAPLHRLSGTVVFGLSIPVVFHCVWALGYRTGEGRLVVHAWAGLAAYALYVAKVLARPRDDRPVWAMPVLGTALGVAVLLAWVTSALVHYTGGGA